MKIGILGTPVSSGNRGVLALSASLLNLCAEASDGGEVVLLLLNRNGAPVPFRVGGRTRLVRVVNARLSPRSAPRDHFLWVLAMSALYRLVPLARVRARIARSTPWVRAVAEADFVGDVRGGDSFSDIYGMKRFVLGFLMAATVLLVKGRMVQFPQTYGPYKNGLARRMARFLLRRSSTVIARDLQSQHVAQDTAGDGRPVLLSPDVAFSLEAIRPENVQLDPVLGNTAPTRVIGLNVNGLMYNGGYTRGNMFGLKMDYPKFLEALGVALLAEGPGELWLIPHTFAPVGDVESDPDACARLRDALPPELQARVRVVAREYDAHELKGIIGGCDFFVGSRMHSCIAALSQGVPCVGVAYSMKFRGVFESVGMEDWVVDARASGDAEAVARVVELYRRRDAVRAGLAQRADEARRLLREIFARVVSSAAGGSEADPLADNATRREEINAV